MAVLQPNGEMVTEESALPRVSEKYPIFKLPVLRGLGTLGQAMWLGMKALRFSANAALNDGKNTEKPKEISSGMMSLNLLFSLGFFIFLYKFVPLFLATAIGKVVPVLHGRLAVNLMDGLIRITIFLAFLFFMSRMKDIRRVFEFHGAEHKVVFNFESSQSRSGTLRSSSRFTPAAAPAFCWS